MGGTGDTSTDFVQFLNSSGTYTSHSGYTFLPEPEEVRTMYRAMVRARAVDGVGVTLQRQGELALWPSLLGQEAAQVGSVLALQPGDHVFPSYRDHAVAFGRGLDPLTVFRLYRGLTHGGWDPARHHLHLYTLVIGSQVLHATGYAMAAAIDGADLAVLVYFGDGATSQGDVSEALNFAAVFNAPVVFFCQNNQWAISEGNERQSRVPLYHRGRGFGVPGVRVDGNDVFACLAVTRDALDRARDGQGPTFIEAYTYRMGAHTTSDDPSRYRDAAEVEDWARRDPIARLRAFLHNCGWADDDFFDETAADCEREARRIRDAVRSLPEPDLATLFAHTYGGQHALVDEELAEFRAYAASAAGSMGDCA